MTNPDNVVLRQTAGAWVSLLQNGAVSADDRQRFDVWLQSDPAHRAAFEEAQHAWDRFQLLADQSSHLYPLTPARPRARRVALLAAGGLAAAACAALAFVVFAPPPGAVYQTAIGAQRVVRLADGSSIDLNTDSKVYVALSAGKRAIALTRGEALFTVAPDKSRPFVVATPNGDVVAVGTAFLVRLDGASTKVLVTKGVVAVDNRPDTALGQMSGWLNGGAASEQKLAAAEQTALGAVVAAKQRVSAREQDRVLAWREGMLRFDDAALSDVVRETERYTKVRFEIADADLAAMRLGISYPASDAAGFVRVLEYGLPVKAVWLSPTRVRIERAS